MMERIMAIDYFWVRNLVITCSAVLTALSSLAVLRLSLRGGGRVLALFSLFLASLLFMELRGGPFLPESVGAWCSVVGVLMYVLVAPPFYHALCSWPAAPALRWAYGAVWGAVASIIVVSLSGDGRFDLFVGIALFLTIAWGIGMAVYRFKRIDDALPLRFLRRFFILSAAFFPLLLADMLGSRFTWAWIAPFDDLSLPVFLAVVDALVLAEGRRWLRPIPVNRDTGESEPAETPVGMEELSPREREIAFLILEGRSAKEIGSLLGISAKTAENHTYRLFKKVGANSRLQFYALMRAVRAGIE